MVDSIRCSDQTGFDRKPAASGLRFHKRKKLPVHRLPFVGPVPGKVGFSFWRVPKTGGYEGGCRTGEALAYIYLKHLREHGSGVGWHLRKITLDMCDCKGVSGEEADATHGQIVGFFGALDEWLEVAMKHLGSQLDSLDNAALLKQANAGLSFDIEAYKATLSSHFKGEEV